MYIFLFYHIQNISILNSKKKYYYIRKIEIITKKGFKSKIAGNYLKHKRKKINT